MAKDPAKYLFDVLDSARFLREFTADRTVDSFLRDRGFRSAIERELQIIGEAMMQLSRVDLHLVSRISEHQRIIGFRHVIVHGYDKLDRSVVWHIVEEKLPVLEREAEVLLRELEGP